MPYGADRPTPLSQPSLSQPSLSQPSLARPIPASSHRTNNLPAPYLSVRPGPPHQPLRAQLPCASTTTRIITMLSFTKFFSKSSAAATSAKDTGMTRPAPVTTSQFTNQGIGYTHPANTKKPSFLSRMLPGLKASQPKTEPLKFYSAAELAGEDESGDICTRSTVTAHPGGKAPKGLGPRMVAGVAKVFRGGEVGKTVQAGGATTVVSSEESAVATMAASLALRSSEIDIVPVVSATASTAVSPSTPALVSESSDTPTTVDPASFTFPDWECVWTYPQHYRDAFGPWVDGTFPDNLDHVLAARILPALNKQAKRFSPEMRMRKRKARRALEKMKVPKEVRRPWAGSDWQWDKPCPRGTCKHVSEELEVHPDILCISEGNLWEIVQEDREEERLEKERVFAEAVAVDQVAVDDIVEGQRRKEFLILNKASNGAPMWFAEDIAELMVDGKPLSGQDLFTRLFRNPDEPGRVNTSTRTVTTTAPAPIIKKSSASKNKKAPLVIFTTPPTPPHLACCPDLPAIPEASAADEAAAEGAAAPVVAQPPTPPPTVINYSRPTSIASLDSLRLSLYGDSYSEKHRPVSPPSSFESSMPTTPVEVECVMALPVTHIDFTLPPSQDVVEVVAVKAEGEEEEWVCHAL
ncbi:hypothetical protein IAT38_001344 [Cryptococcus sp. DSM 104549]